VKAQILVLDDGVSADLATDMPRRGEGGTQDRTQPYAAGTKPNSVQCERTTHPSVTTILYTDFLPALPLPRFDPHEPDRLLGGSAEVDEQAFDPWP
jgi:hypothetical protein